MSSQCELGFYVLTMQLESDILFHAKWLEKHCLFWKKGGNSKFYSSGDPVMTKSDLSITSMLVYLCAYSFKYLTINSFSLLLCFLQYSDWE